MKDKIFLFDFDGTMFDSMSVWEHLGSLYLHEKGLLVHSEVDKILSTMTFNEGVEYLNTKYLPQLSLDEIEREMKDLLTNYYLEKVLPKNSILSFLQQAYTLGIPLYILSAGEKELIIKVLKKYNIDTLFEEIYMCNDLHLNKKTKAIYHYLGKLLNVSSDQIYVFEDVYYAAKSAKEAGCKVIGVQDAYQDAMIKEIVDIYISDFMELEEIL
ncbi:MAG: HAD family hydrolase [Coprobacillaceae bacterium]